MRERVGGDRAPDVHRAVDRVDDDARPGVAVAEADLAALLGDRGELAPAACSALELLEDDVLAAAVDLQRHVAALAEALVDGARGDPARARAKSSRCAGDDPPAGVEPVALRVGCNGIVATARHPRASC